MQPGDLFIGTFINNQDIGYHFLDWPIHVTIMPWIRGSKPIEDLVTKLGNELAKLEPFNYSIDPETHFGSNTSVAVNLVNRPTPFEQLYILVDQIMYKNRYKLVTKRFPEYQPHVTIQKTGRVHEGENYLCKYLYIVEQKGTDKEIVARLELGK